MYFLPNQKPLDGFWVNGVLAISRLDLRHRFALQERFTWHQNASVIEQSAKAYFEEAERQAKGPA